ncbi:LemA family protein [Candidatus Zixiibacteriota bacterium]
MSSEHPPAEEKHNLRISLGILFFLLIMIMAVITVGIVSLRSLISHEGAVTQAWSEIQAIQDSRRGLMVEIVRAMETARYPLTWRDRWLEARDEAETAPSFLEEVPAFAGLDVATDRLLLEIRQSQGIDSLQSVSTSIEVLEQLNASLGSARYSYNEKVREYQGQRERIPIRWFARLFGFGEVLEYLRVVVR